MGKFKVGDKVRILDATQIAFAVEFGFKTDEIYEVLEVLGNGIPVIKDEDSRLSLYPAELQYIEKVKNNQRITALEKEVAELRPLKEKVEYLEQAVQQYFAVPGEPSTVNEVSNIYHHLVVKNVKQLPEAEKLAQEKGLTHEDLQLILSTFKLRDEKASQVAGTTSEENKKTASQEVNDFQKLFSVLEADYDLGVIELPSYVFDLPDSYKERVFKIYQILRDGKTPNVFAYAILDMVRAAFNLTER